MSRCPRGMRKNKSRVCVTYPPSERKRCPNGTRKNKQRVCIPKNLPKEKEKEEIDVHQTNLVQYYPMYKVKTTPRPKIPRPKSGKQSILLQYWK